jgi:hypothetical protein
VRAMAETTGVGAMTVTILLGLFAVLLTAWVGAIMGPRWRCWWHGHDWHVVQGVLSLPDARLCWRCGRLEARLEVT